MRAALVVAAAAAGVAAALYLAHLVWAYAVVVTFITELIWRAA